MSPQRFWFGLLVAVGGLIAVSRLSLPSVERAGQSQAPKGTRTYAAPRSPLGPPLPKAQGLPPQSPRPLRVAFQPTLRLPSKGPGLLDFPTTFAASLPSRVGASSRPLLLPKPACDIIVLVEGMT